MATILNAYNLTGGDTTSSTFTSTGDCITIEATTTSINGVNSLIKIQSSDDESVWKDIGQIILGVGSDLYCNDPVKVTGLYVRCLLITNDSTSGTITINATEQTEGSGGTLNQTLVLGNTTGGEDISISNGDKIVLDNGSELRVGTYDFGGTGGISRICSVGYEDMWQSGIHHIFDNNGLIRESNNCFDINPDNTFDNTLRFKVGSRWVLDDGTTYMCTDASTGAAVWALAGGGDMLAANNLSDVADEATALYNIAKIKSGKFSLDTNDLFNLDTAPYSLASVFPAVVGNFWVILSCQMKYTFNTTSFDNRINIGCSTAISGLGTILFNMNGYTEDAFCAASINQSAYKDYIINDFLHIGTQDTATTGDGSAIFYITAMLVEA